MSSRSSLKLSKAAQALWGKTDLSESRAWLPLYIHMYDSCRVAERLWEVWVPNSTKNVIRRGLGERSSLAKRLFLFLSAIHDIGKATPAFQMTPIWVEGACTCFISYDERAGFTFPPRIHASKAPKHTVAGQLILEDQLASFGVEISTSRSLTSIIGGHHGTPSDSDRLCEARDAMPSELGRDDKIWAQAQYQLLTYARTLVGLTQCDITQLFGAYVPPSTTSILLGLVIMVDWIASDQELFPLVSLEPGGELLKYARGETIDFDALSQRFERAWRGLDLLPCWSEDLPASWRGLYSERFTFPNGAAPRPVQLAALNIAAATQDPGLMLIEAPMGEGKTEAALAAAEVLGTRLGCGGICVALPTMATTDAVFGRVHAWLERLPQPEGKQAGSVYLAHGKAQLNEEFMGIARGDGYQSIGQDLGSEEAKEERAVVSDWMYGRKRGVLANFVVCTIDQVLMGALQMKHLALRQLALANKVVVIDECHAYDTYMQQYLSRILEWMGSWHVPVILLSATLPQGLRSEFERAYLKGRESTDRGVNAAPNKKGPISLQSLLSPHKSSDSKNIQIEAAPENAYPLISYSNGLSIRYKALAPKKNKSTVELKLLSDDVASLTQLLGERLSGGGCAGVICDTVGRAQEAYEALADRFGSSVVTLTHARFTDLDRMDNEKAIREMLGPRSTLENGKRPKLHIVVGTQVLEQSLDIDFDLLVTDVAPIDLLFQRIGRVHRHAREVRPAKATKATCFIRGIDSWDAGLPRFSRGVKTVYEEASLFETLAVCGLDNEAAESSVVIPDDIARLVRLAYRGGTPMALGIPDAWQEDYIRACDCRTEKLLKKKNRAQFCLLKSEANMLDDRQTLTGWYSPQKMVVESGCVRDADRGPRAVRDTQETVEVMALCLQEGRVRLLPWIGDARHGVKAGAEVPTQVVPKSMVAKVAAQSTVRLPLSLCSPQKIDELIDELERMDAPYVGAWQESPWLEGQLALFFRPDEAGAFAVEVMGQRLKYSRDTGLAIEKMDNSALENPS